MKLQQAGEAEKRLLLIESGTKFLVTRYDARDAPGEMPSPLCTKLRKELKGKVLADVRALGVDRVVAFRFGAGPGARHVVLELYFRRADVSPMNRGAAAAANVDLPGGRVAATPRVPRGLVRGDDERARSPTDSVGSGGLRRGRRRGYSVGSGDATAATLEIAEKVRRGKRRARGRELRRARGAPEPRDLRRRRGAERGRGVPSPRGASCDESRRGRGRGADIPTGRRAEGARALEGRGQRMVSA